MNITKIVLTGSLSLALHAQQLQGLKIAIIEGQGSVNSIRKSEGSSICRRSFAMKQGRIVPTARVQFSTPGAGPSGEVGGQHTFLAWTDTAGRARRG